MSYTRPSHSSKFRDGSATDGTVLVGALADGLEAVEEKLDGSTEFGLGLLTPTDAAAARTLLDAASTAFVTTTTLAKSTDESRKAREQAAVWSLANDATLAQLTKSGLTVSSGYIAASTGGTDGTAVFPLWGRKEVRASFRVKCTKGTASSKSYVGYDAGTRGTVPAGGTYTFGGGYLQGTGLVIIRENVGAAITIVADASITDGDEYDLTFQVDGALSALSSSAGVVTVRAVKVSDGTVSRAQTTFNQALFSPVNAVVRTNVAAGSITNLVVSNHPVGEIGNISNLTSQPYSTAAAEPAFMWFPAKSNGKLVIAMHGHGGSDSETGAGSPFTPTWLALAGAGFTVAVPQMGGNLWGNNTAQGYLYSLYANLVSLYDLDPGVFLWGNSMGGGASLTAIAKGTFPVRAAYLAEPTCDLAAMYATGNFPTIATAYPTTGDRDANDPMKFSASAFAGVPMLFLASASDTTVSKTAQTDAMRTKLGSTVPNYLITATGIHNDTSHFRAYDTLNFFRANMRH